MILDDEILYVWVAVAAASTAYAAWDHSVK